MHQDSVKALSRRSLPVLLVLGLGGCASSPDVDELGLAQPLAYESVTVTEGEPTESFTERGVVRGSVCYRSTFEFELKSKDAAIREMRRQAAEMGANAIIRLQCQSLKRRDWLRNCLAEINCTGVGVSYDAAR